MVGAFAAAALLYVVHFNAIDSFNTAAKTQRDQAGGLAPFSIFARFPAPYFKGDLSIPLIDQIVGTAFLVIFIVATMDMPNMALKVNLGPS